MHSVGPTRWLATVVCAVALAGCGSSVLHPVSNLIKHHKSIAIAACIVSVDRAIHDARTHHDLAALYRADRSLVDCKHA
ncbi:MAG: hypothetical protein ABSC56_02265 [Solirubrobacteraceae bacterium]